MQRPSNAAFSLTTGMADMKEYVVYRHGWNDINQNASHGLPEKMAVGRIEAESAEEACRLVGRHVLLLGGQHLTAETRGQGGQQGRGPQPKSLMPLGVTDYRYHWNGKRSERWLGKRNAASRRWRRNNSAKIARKGGRAAHQKGTAHQFNSTEAAEAGRKGGKAVSRNREHMAAIGRKGGRAAHRGQATEATPEGHS